MSMLYGGTRARRRPIAPCNVRMRRSAMSDLSSTRPRRPRLPGGRGRGARQTSGVRAGRGGRTSPAAAPGTAHQTFDARALRQGTSPGHFARGHLLRFRSHVGASVRLSRKRDAPTHRRTDAPLRWPMSAGRSSAARQPLLPVAAAYPHGFGPSVTLGLRICRRIENILCSATLSGFGST